MAVGERSGAQAVSGWPKIIAFDAIGTVSDKPAAIRVVVYGVQSVGDTVKRKDVEADVSRTATYHLE